MVLTGELRDPVQVNGAPVPALRYDSGKACSKLASAKLTCAELGGASAVGQQHAELGCDTGTGLVLKTAFSQYALKERTGGCEARRPRR